MYYTHLYRDAQTKVEVIALNRKDMILTYIMSEGKFRHKAPFMLDMEATRKIVFQWCDDNPRADWEHIMDFCSTLLTDWKENNDDLR